MKRMQDVNLSAKAYSKIYSHVLSKAGYDLSRVENGAVSIKAEDYNYNNPSAKVRFASTTWYKSRTKFKINVAQEGNGVKDELAVRRKYRERIRGSRVHGAWNKTLLGQD